MVNGPVRPFKLIQAHRLLLDLLSRGPVPTDVCIERAREHGIGRRTLEKARQLLLIRTTHARGTPGAAHLADGARRGTAADVARGPGAEMCGLRADDARRHRAAHLVRAVREGEAERAEAGEA
jgi:hypothetical protein